MAVTLKETPKKPQSTATHLAHLILSHTCDTSRTFRDIFESILQSRNAKGTPRDDEQDLLRAMLLFTSAGLDSTVKQLVRDTLPIIVGHDIGAHREFEKFVVRELRSNSVDSTLDTLDVKTLASLIVEDSPKDALVRGLVGSITSNSLQSVDQLLRVAAHFGIPASELYRNLDDLREVFDVRNKISHEMDIDFSQSNRSRFPRRKKDMIGYTNILLDVAISFLYIVDEKLQIAERRTRP